MLSPLSISADCKAVLFDLDGTLVDSSHGILQSLAYAFDVHGITPQSHLEPSLIGPPLRQTIETLSPDTNLNTIEAIIESFKLHYDDKGYRSTIVFDQILDLLENLVGHGIRLAIATNKREVPTKAIINNFFEHHNFSAVYSPDSIQPHSTNKGHLIQVLLRDLGWNPSQCLYIGDRIEDWYAARFNHVRFAWAKWGFGTTDIVFDDDSFVLAKPDPQIILNKMSWN